MLVGAVVGAAGGTAVAPVVGTAVGAGGGGMALPMALREALIQNIKNGAIKDPQDFLDRALAISWEAARVRYRCRHDGRRKSGRGAADCQSARQDHHAARRRTYDHDNGESRA